MPIKVIQFLQQPNAKLKHLSEQGFTLVESLMAMVVISIVIVAMTPPIFLAVGTRVQNRRAEQAMQLAQGEIDRIRVLVEQGDYEVGQLPKEVLNTTPTTFKNVAAPTSVAPNIIKSNITCPNPPYTPYTGQQIPPNQVLRVDTNSKCETTEFLLQTFRDVGQPVPALPTDTPMAFNMGVRVYAAVAEQNVANLQIDRAPLKFTTGLGSQRSHPLAVIYTKIARSDLAPSLDRYNDLLLPE